MLEVKANAGADIRSKEEIAQDVTDDDKTFPFQIQVEQGLRCFGFREKLRPRRCHIVSIPGFTPPSTSTRKSLTGLHDAC